MFLKLTLMNGEKTFVNMSLVYEMRTEQYPDGKGSRLFVSTGGEGDAISVKESCEEIIYALGL